jgi:dihydrofolate reductase
VRKIIYQLSVSLDGFFEAPNRDISWHMVDDELHTHFNDELSTMSAFLDGRVTHELMAGYWPTADQDPNASAPTAEFARIWREMPKIVYSTTLERADWNTTIVRAVVPEEVDNLKAQPGGDMVVGGPNLAATFIRHHLVDEYRVYIHPIVIGQGTPMFPPSDTRIPLHLVETRRFGNGVVLVRYEQR